jgi:hypothetical protein
VSTVKFEELEDEEARQPGDVLATQQEVESAAGECYRVRSTKQRLMKSATYILHTTTILKGRCQPEDLLAEAVFAVLTGRRAWKTNAVDFVGLLIGVMKSLAYSQDNSLKTKDRHVVLEGELRPKDAEEVDAGVVESYGNDEDSPESILLAAEEAAREASVFVVLRAQFARDDLAGQIIDKLAERKGLTDAEIRQELNVSSRKYWSADKRVTGAIERFIKNGMKK